MRLKARQGFASMPSRRRSACVSSRSTRSKGSENLSHISSRHCRRSEAGVRIRTRWMRRRRSSSLRISPASTVLPEADVVGDQQVDARHAQRLEQRHELVVLDLHRRRGRDWRSAGARAAPCRPGRGRAWSRVQRAARRSASKSSAGIGSEREGSGSAVGSRRRACRASSSQSSCSSAGSWSSL